MNWDDLIAAVGGGAEGVQKQKNFNATLDNKNEIEQLKAQLAILGMGSKETIAGNHDATQADIAGGHDATAVTTTGMRTGSAETIATGKNDTAESIAGAHDATTKEVAGNKLNADLGKFWGGTMPLGWANYDQRGAIAGQASSDRRAIAGQSSADRRFGIATTAGTAARGQDINQRGQNLTDQRGRAGLAIRQSQNWFAQPGQDTIDLTQPATTAVAPVPAAAPPAMPASSSAAPAAPAAPAMPQGLAPGATVKLKNGQTVIIKTVDPATGQITY